MENTNHGTTNGADVRELEGCQHAEACVEAVIGGEAGTPWQVLDTEQRDLDGIHATVALGVCVQCASRVVSVRAFDVETWTPEHGPAWTSRWTRLVHDSESGGRS
jgi:hypothetical protein